LELTLFSSPGVYIVRQHVERPAGWQHVGHRGRTNNGHVTFVVRRAQHKLGQIPAGRMQRGRGDQPWS